MHRISRMEMAGKSMKLSAKCVAWMVGGILLILSMELIRAVFFQDLSHLMAQRNCEGRLCDLVDAVRDTDQTFDPGTIPEGHECVSFMPGEGAASLDGEVSVAAADAKLFHTKQGPFGLPVLYAVVVTTSGIPLTWQGDEHDYAAAIENAKRSPTGRIPGIFWKEALNWSTISRDLQD